MNLSFRSFSSGSSGNCYMIKAGETVILVDVGISGKRILEGLEECGIEKDQVAGILVTHEHTDHVKSLKILTKKMPRVQVFANEKTWVHIDEKVQVEQQRIFVTGEGFEIGDISIKPFNISHDAAEPVGYSIKYEDKQISIVTDTGCLTEEIFEEIKESNIIVLEANHDVNMLKMCRYPWNTKQRILGKTGHLSNDDAGLAICRLIGETKKEQQIVLAHLSRENNFPDMAYQTIKNVLEEAGYYIGKHVQISTIVKDQISRTFEAV